MKFISRFHLEFTGTCVHSQLQTSNDLYTVPTTCIVLLKRYNAIKREGSLMIRTSN